MVKLTKEAVFPANLSVLELAQTGNSLPRSYSAVIAGRKYQRQAADNQFVH